MCAKSRKWKNANNTEFGQSACRSDLRGAANADASKGNAAFLSHRRTTITDHAETDSGGSKGPERSAVCLREVNHNSFTFKPPSIPVYSHFYESLSAKDLNDACSIRPNRGVFFTFICTEVKTRSIIHKRTQIQTDTSSNCPDQSWTKQSGTCFDYNDKGI